jgi:hypothetical protein
MRTRTLQVLAPAALGLVLTALAAAVPATETGIADFADAKAKAEASGKLILVDFSAPA